MTTVGNASGRREVAAGLLWQWAIRSPGTVPVTTGGLAEQCTATELRKLRRRGWLLINRVTLTRPDTDHVLVGPGGMIAIESEWSTQQWTPDCAQLQSAARQARRNALRLALWHGLRPLQVGAVGSAVFLWGPGASGLEAPFHLGGTAIVPGHSVSEWRADLTGGRLTPQQVDQAWRALDARCRATEPG